MNRMAAVVQPKQGQRNWYALYTRPRFEKKVDSILKQQDVHSFLPQRVVVRYWSNHRKKKISEPLFPSYVFVHVNSAELYIASQAYGVARLVRFGVQPACIPKEQIEAIYRILQHGYEPEPCQVFNFGDEDRVLQDGYVPELHSSLAYGEEVEIVSGPLRGLRGVYIEDRGKHRLVLSVGVIQQAIAITVKRGQIRRIKASEIHK